MIIAVRDGARYVGAAIDSILAQTRPPQEVLVVDDGSEDGTVAIASGYGPPVRCIEQGRMGAPAANNRGLAEARGELIAFLDADDLWEPRKLELQLAALERDPELDVVFCQVEQFHSPELSDAERSRIRLPSGSFPGIAKGALLARRSAVDRVGGFDERWALPDFLDWYARAQDAGLRSSVLPEVLLRRRLHATNWGLRGDRREYARVLGEVLRRRRARDGPPGGKRHRA